MLKVLVIHSERERQKERESASILNQGRDVVIIFRTAANSMQVYALTMGKASVAEGIKRRHLSHLNAASSNPVGDQLCLKQIFLHRRGIIDLLVMIAGSSSLEIFFYLLFSPSGAYMSVIVLNNSCSPHFTMKWF